VEREYADNGDPPVYKIVRIKNIKIKSKTKIYHNEVSLFFLQIGIKTK